MNIAVGRYALAGLSLGDLNVAIGADAGTYVSNGGATVTETNNSVYIGSNTYVGATSGRTNQIVIGYGAQGYGSNYITLGNNSITRLHCNVQTISILSDSRVKEDVFPADIERCFQAVKDLPVTRYKYKDFTGAHIDKHVSGFMADDVEKIFPKSVSTTDRYFPLLDENGEHVYEEIEEDTEDIDENSEKIIRKQKRKVEKQFLMENVKDLTMTEAVPTLWGAVQYLTKIVEKLQSDVEELKSLSR